MSAPVTLPFWRTKTLAEMTPAEWESLCDGCGKCCLHKIEDADDGRYYYTNVACRLLNLGTGRCTAYEHRCDHVPDCVHLTAVEVGDLGWLPSSCAYRLLAAGKDLPWWHPLVSGDLETVHRAGASVRGRAISETRATGPLDHHIITWVD